MYSCPRNEICNPLPNSCEYPISDILKNLDEYVQLGHKKLARHENSKFRASLRIL